MRSVSFRVLSTAIWLLLLFALAAVIVLVVRDNPSGTESVTSPNLQQTPAENQANSAVDEPSVIRPTFTSTPSAAAVDEIRLLSTKRVLAGGFSFRPADGYAVEVIDGTVTLTGDDADSSLGPSLLLIGGADSPLIDTNTDSLGSAFEQFVDAFAEQGGFDFSDQAPFSTESMQGITASLSNQATDKASQTRPFEGKIFMARPNPPQFFVMIGIAPTAEWDAKVANEFSAVLESVSLFTLTKQYTETSLSRPTDILITDQQGEQNQVSSSTGAPTPTPQNVVPAGDSNDLNAVADTQSAGEIQANAEEDDASDVQPVADRSDSGQTSEILANSAQSAETSSGWRAYTNGNFINDGLILDEILWAATEGGVLGWDESGQLIHKFTSTDGLLANNGVAIAACNITNLGLVVGTHSGLQIFNPEQERWSTLTSATSLMSYDDVSDLYCDSANEFMVVGYQRHGIDIFDFRSNEWLHFDRNRALVSNIVEYVTVVGDRKEVWIVSDLGLTVLENIPELDNRRSSFFSSDNSQLQDGPIYALAKATDDSIWVVQDDALLHVEKVDQSVAGSSQREWTSYSSRDIGFSGQSLRTVAASEDGSIWIGSASAELCQFDPRTEVCTETSALADSLADASDIEAEELASVTISALFTGADGLVYAATYGHGISVYDGTNWQPFQADDTLLSTNQIRHLAEGNDGTIWVATSEDVQLVEKQGGGLRQTLVQNQAATTRARQGNSEQFRWESEENSLTAMWSGAEGHVWLGSEYAGKYSNQEWTLYSSLNGLMGKPVQAFAVDAQDRTWIGTGNGLNILNEDAFFSLTTDQGLPDDDIRAILADSRGTRNVVWIGTSEGGLLRFEKNQLQVFNQRSANLPSNNVQALGFDVDGSLLVGTSNGLARLVGGRAIKIRAVGDAKITAIATSTSENDDEIGSIWVGTEEDGLYHYNGLAWSAVPPENVPDPHISALLIDNDNTVWIGGANGGIIQHRPASELP